MALPAWLAASFIPIAKDFITGAVKGTKGAAGAVKGNPRPSVLMGGLAAEIYLQSQEMTFITKVGKGVLDFFNSGFTSEQHLVVGLIGLLIVARMAPKPIVQPNTN